MCFTIYILILLLLGCNKKFAATFHQAFKWFKCRRESNCNKCDVQFYASQNVWILQHLCRSSPAPQAFQDMEERLWMWRVEGVGEGWVGVRRQKLSRLRGRGTHESDMAESIQTSRDCHRNLGSM